MENREKLLKDAVNLMVSEIRDSTQKLFKTLSLNVELEFLVKSVDQPKRRMNLLDLKAICNKQVPSYYAEGISNRSREKEVLFPRQIFYYIAHKREGFTQDSVGSFIGFDHASVLHGCRQVQNLILSDKLMISYYEKIKQDVEEFKKNAENKPKEG